MKSQGYQDPKIETREDDAKRPYYCIRPYVAVITEDGLKRIQKRIHLGFVDEITVREAKIRKERHMAVINDCKLLIQSRVPFKVVLDKYIEVRLPQIPRILPTATETRLRSTFDPISSSSRMARKGGCCGCATLTSRWSRHG